MDGAGASDLSYLIHHLHSHLLSCNSFSRLGLREKFPTFTYQKKIPKNSYTHTQTMTLRSAQFRRDLAARFFIFCLFLSLSILYLLYMYFYLYLYILSLKKTRESMFSIPLERGPPLPSPQQPE